MYSVLSDFIDLLFPRFCASCSKILVTGEETLCISCFYNLPVLSPDEEELILQPRLWGKLNASVHGYLKYEKGGKVQKLLFGFKYKGCKEIGKVLGKSFALSLAERGCLNDVNLVLPVPLHQKKLKIRGYNQSEILSEAFSRVTGIRYDTSVLERSVHSGTQTKKSRIDRWLDSEIVYKVTNSERVLGKNILLVDDVITTGATFEVTGNLLLEAGAGKITCAALAVAV